MKRLLKPGNRERGSSLVEYAVVVAIMILGLVPAIDFAGGAVTTVLDASVAPYVVDPGDTVTTTTVTPTTTTVPPTTTTTSTTTTTMASTTTTMPAGPNQFEVAQFEDQITVEFSEDDGLVTYDNVVAPGWTYVVTDDSGANLRLVFRTTSPNHKVVVRGFLKNGVLKTKVVEKY